jgi:ribosomal protein S14
MKLEKINIIKDKLKRKKKIKRDLKNKLLKSIIQNKKVKPVIRIYAFYLIYNKNIKNNMCLITGRFGGVYKFCNMSRQTIKKFSSSNKLQNIKIVS